MDWIEFNKGWQYKMFLHHHVCVYHHLHHHHHHHHHHCHHHHHLCHHHNHYHHYHHHHHLHRHHRHHHHQWITVMYDYSLHKCMPWFKLRLTQFHASYPIIMCHASCPIIMCLSKEFIRFYYVNILNVMFESCHLFSFCIPSNAS